MEQTNENLAVVLDTKPAKKDVNKFRLVISQNIPAHINVKGETIAAFNSEVEFNDQTVQAVTTENVAAWAIMKLDNWLHIKRLQGKTGLKLSKDVQIIFEINGKQEKTAMKFTMNKERLVKKMHTMPELLGRIFVARPGIAKSTLVGAEKMIMETNKLLLAEAKNKKEPEVKTPLLDAAIIALNENNEEVEQKPAEILAN